jgi:hypothetical protein
MKIPLVEPKLSGDPRSQLCREAVTSQVDDRVFFSFRILESG